jgi:hypothetical protein
MVIIIIISSSSSSSSNNNNNSSSSNSTFGDGYNNLTTNKIQRMAMRIRKNVHNWQSRKHVKVG